MVEEKIDQILEEIRSLKAGQQSLTAGQQKLEAGQQSLTAGQQKLEEGQQENSRQIQKIGIQLEKVASDVKGIADGHIDLRRDMAGMKTELKEEIGLVTNQLDLVAKDLTKQIKETRQDINRVEDKLDAHMRQPVHA